MTTRSEGKMRKSASLRKLKDAHFLSLVDSPANRTGFKIIRSADDAPEADHMETIESRRFDSPLLSIILPQGVTEEQAYELMDVYALGDDYEVAERNGQYMFMRKGVRDGIETTSFDLGGDIVANVVTESLATRSDESGHVAVTSIEFQKEHFSELADVQRWLRGKDVTFKEGGVEVVDGGFIVTRHDVPEGTTTNRVTVQDGVTAIIALADREDIPTSVISPISEAAYGSYGWGHIDFAQSMADEAFTEASWNALSTLGRVLEEIMFYSVFNVEERKVLIERATSQFSSFMSAMMDVLPGETLIQIRSDIRNRKEFAMITVDDSKSGLSGKVAEASTEEQATEAVTEEATRSDETASSEESTEQKTEATSEETTEEAQRTDSDGETETSAQADTSEEEQSSATSETVTRSEIEEMVNKAVEKVLAERQDPTAEALTGIQDTMKQLVESVSEVKRSSTESSEALAKKVEELESTTIVRSDDDDTAAMPSGKSVFNGVFGPLG